MQCDEVVQGSLAGEALTTAFAKHLTMRVSKELCALLKVVHNVHPELQALLIDLMQYHCCVVDWQCRARALTVRVSPASEPCTTSSHCTGTYAVVRYTYT